MKPRYERPIIVRHVVGGMNKFGAQTAMRVYDRFEGLPIAELVAQYGSPLMLFSERVLREKYRELRDQVAARIPRFTFVSEGNPFRRLLLGVKGLVGEDVIWHKNSPVLSSQHTTRKRYIIVV